MNNMYIPVSTQYFSELKTQWFVLMWSHCSTYTVHVICICFSNSTPIRCYPFQWCSIVHNILLQHV